MNRHKQDELISASYLELNSQLHESRASYGANGAKWVGMASQLVDFFGACSLVDYGAGKRTLEIAYRSLHPTRTSLAITSYDPSTPGYDTLPARHDLLICTDVMEHIEPQKLDSVIRHTAELTRRAAFFSISTRPAAKSLADGRNAHLIINDSVWWQKRLSKDFIVAWGQVDPVNNEFVSVCLPRSMSWTSLRARARLARSWTMFGTAVLSGVCHRLDYKPPALSAARRPR